MKNNKIGIVTVLYNSESVLEDFFRTLNEQNYKNFILYIVDNNSTDSSVKKSEECAKNVSFECKWLLQSDNLGVAEGNNIGVKSALADKCDYILLANNDIVLKEDTIKTLFDGMLETNSTMAVPKIYYWDNPNKIWMAGGGFNLLRFTTYHRGENELDKGQYNIRAEIEYAPTCFMLITASVFDRIGFMDKRYFVYYDDTDFVWRSTKLGYERLMYIPESSLWHKVSSCTGGSISNFTIYFGNRNNIFFALKYSNGLRTVLYILYLITHFLLRKLFIYSSDKYLLILKAYKDGWDLYKEFKNDYRAKE